MEWGFLSVVDLEALMSIIGVVFATVLYKLRMFPSVLEPPKLRSTLKTDLELFNTLENDPRNRDILKAHIDATIDRIYRPRHLVFSTKFKGTKFAANWRISIMSIVLCLVFSYWTSHLLSRDVFSGWAIITGFFAFVYGVTVMASFFVEPEATKPEVAEKIKTMGDTKEIKKKRTRESKLVAYTIHKGSYNKLGEAFQRLSQWISKEGFEIIGHPTGIYYNDPNTIPEEDLLTEVQIPIKRK